MCSCLPLQNILPRFAAKLDVAPISDITGIEGEDVFVRTIYAGNAVTRIKSKDSVKVVTVRGTAFPPAEETGGSGTVEDGEGREEGEVGVRGNEGGCDDERGKGGV